MKWIAYIVYVGGVYKGFIAPEAIWLVMSIPFENIKNLFWEGDKKNVTLEQQETKDAVLKEELVKFVIFSIGGIICWILFK